MSRTKLIVIVVVLLAVAAGIAVISLADISMRNPWLDGETETAIVGDLVIPVTATGTVEAAKLIEIKSKASGQVAKTHVVEGQMVKEGDILVALDPIDEKRIVEAQQASLDRATSAWEKAKIGLENLRLDLPLQTQSAQYRLDDAEARYQEAEYQWERIQRLAEEGHTTDVEVTVRKTAHLAAKAARDLVGTDLQRAKNNEDILVRSAEKDVTQAEAAARQSQKALDEAKLRLEETTVQARSDGMVYSILVREGEMIQSGTVSLMGGTRLMMLADTSAMFVIAQVDEADIGSIREIAPEYAQPGKTQKLEEEVYRQKAQQVVDELQDRIVDVTVDAYRSETFRGVIERILPEPIRANNALAFRVRIRLVGEDLEKLMGLQADLSFMTEKQENVVLVKNEALHSEGRKCYVYKPVPDKPRDEEKVLVEIGKTDGTYTHILSGVEAGEEVFIKRPKKTQKEKQASGE